MLLRRSSTMAKPSLAKVVDFWFSELGGVEKWFMGGKQVDDLCRTRFLPLYEEMVAKTPPEALTDATSALGAIIVYDQFPRNMFRKTARAFATDPQALLVAKNAVAKGFDKSLTETQNLFLYMPFVHSENLDDQSEALRLFQDADEMAVKQATEHWDIISRFGRFPHRNGVLGRTSTPEEEAFLATHEGFGQ